jgi:tetratricopeptide (TPR) repeat protein
MTESAADFTTAQPCSSSDDEVLRQAANALIQAQDNIIAGIPIPNKKNNLENDFDKADASALNRIAFNLSLINSIRIRSCRLLVSAGLPLLALQEFESLTSLTFDDLDSFYRDLSLSIGARMCRDWYVANSEFISKFFTGYSKEALDRNYMLFSATCIECAVIDEDYELAADISDSCDAKAPFESRFLEWTCIAYWLTPGRGLDAGKWSEIAIANKCTSQYPYIIKCRSLLAMGNLDEAVACLDHAERFFYSIGLKEAYAAILKERSGLMDIASSS